MALNLSLSEILVNLERQIESLREQIGLHAREEEHHRDQRALREAELEQATTHLESFRSVAAVAADLDFPVPVPAVPPPAEDLGRHPTLAGMVERVVADRPEGERFGTRLVVNEVNRRFPQALRRPAEPPAVSLILRRMSAARRIHQVRAGKANQEALYTKEPPPARKKESRP
jgi:hypothetical protein